MPDSPGTTPRFLAFGRVKTATCHGWLSCLWGGGLSKESRPSLAGSWARMDRRVEFRRTRPVVSFRLRGRLRVPACKRPSDIPCDMRRDALPESWSCDGTRRVPRSWRREAACLFGTRGAWLCRSNIPLGPVPGSHPPAVAAEHDPTGCLGRVRVRDGHGLIRLSPPGRIAYDAGPVAGQPPSPGPCRRRPVRRPNVPTGAP